MFLNLEQALSFLFHILFYFSSLHIYICDNGPFNKHEQKLGCRNRPVVDSRTSDRKVSGSSPVRSSRIIFFPRFRFF